MHILFTGPLAPGSISNARVESLRQLGHQVSTLDQRPFFRSSLWQKLQARALFGPTLHAYEHALVEMTRRERPDLLFIDCALYLGPKAVRALAQSGSQVVEYSSDYFGYHSQIYRKLRQATPLYDAHIVTNSLNIEIFRRWGAKRVLVTPFGYDPALHFPIRPTTEQAAKWGADVAFGGHFEPFYAEMLRALKQAGLRLRVSGNSWRNVPFLAAEEKVGQVTPKEYQLMICASKVAPAFLSKWNRNTSGMRTFEVAAMGALLIAERTTEQLGYFQEGREAEFFSGAEELVKHTVTHCRDEDRRRTMAAAGYRRCTTSGYSYVDRMRQLLSDLEESKKR